MKKLSNYLLLLTILLAPLYVIRFKIGPLPTTLLEILIMATVISFIFEKLLVKNGWQILLADLKSPLSVLSLALLLVGLLAVFVSPDHYQGLGIWRAYFFEPILIYYIVLSKLRHFDISRSFLAAWFGGALWISVMGIMQRLTGHFTTPASYHEMTLHRAAAVFNSANDLPLFVGPIAALTPALWRIKKELVLIGFIFVAAVLASGSRGGMLGILSIALVFIVGFFWTKVSSKLKRKLAYSFFGALIVGVIGLGVLFLQINRFSPPPVIVYPRVYSGTTEIRVCLWQGTKNLLLAHPILGVGLDGFRLSYPSFRTCDSEQLQYPHNIFLNIWTELGLAGLAVFFLIYLTSFKSLVRTKGDLLVKLALTGALVYSLIHGMVDVPYFKNDLSLEFWVLLAAIAAFAENKLRFE